jgi:hypothetical protein
MKIPEYKWDVWYQSYGDVPQLFRSCKSRYDARQIVKLLIDVGHKPQNVKMFRYKLLPQ